MIKIKGLDELQNKLQKMSDGLKEIEGSHPMGDIITDTFIKMYTKFNSLQELMDNSGFKIESQDDFKSIPDDDWDKYIASVSKFRNWKEMLDSAMEQYAKSKMGL